MAVRMAQRFTKKDWVLPIADSAKQIAAPLGATTRLLVPAIALDDSPQFAIQDTDVLGAELLHAVALTNSVDEFPCAVSDAT